MFKLFLSLVLSLLFSCGQANQSEVKEEVLVVADTKAELVVEGMSCQVGCASYIDEALEKIDGVVSANVDFESKSCNVSYDNSLISEYNIVNAINTLKDSSYFVSSIDVEILKMIEKKKIDTH